MRPGRIYFKKLDIRPTSATQKYQWGVVVGFRSTIMELPLNYFCSKKY
jgi:hypothetical protein